MFENSTQMALVGGISLGICSLAKIGLSGRVLGISGSFRGLIKNITGIEKADTTTSHQQFLYRLSFVLGMLFGAYYARQLFGDRMEPLKEDTSLFRCLLGGILVGYGTSLCNGCTSGHGITGFARLSARSITSTFLFLSSGILTATIFHTSSVVDFGHDIEEIPLTTALILPFSLLLIFGSLYLVFDRELISEAVFDILLEFVSGFGFSLGLVLSGMNRPANVLKFLDLGLLSDQKWDCNLVFVLIGAHMIVTPGIWGLVRQYKPTICVVNNGPGITDPLIKGSIIFGIGWAICGMCPGPGLVMLLAPCANMVSNCGAVAFIFGVIMATYVTALPPNKDDGHVKFVTFCVLFLLNYLYLLNN